MSRRNTYLLGGLAAVVGVVMLVIAISALTSGGDEDSAAPDGQTGSEQPLSPESPSGGTPSPGAEEPSAADTEGAAIQQRLARRRPVRAPDFAAEVIHAGTAPPPLRDAFDAGPGDALRLSELAGTPVVLHLWSSRCIPCRAAAPLVAATWRRWGQRGVLFVGVNVDESPAAANAIIRQYDLTYPVVSDRGGEIARRYGAAALPHTVFISGSGNIVGEVAGGPSVRQLETGAAAAESGRVFGAERGSGMVPLR